MRPISQYKHVLWVLLTLTGTYQRDRWVSTGSTRKLNTVVQSLAPQATNHNLNRTELRALQAPILLLFSSPQISWLASCFSSLYQILSPNRDSVASQRKMDVIFPGLRKSWLRHIKKNLMIPPFLLLFYFQEWDIIIFRGPTFRYRLHRFRLQTQDLGLRWRF